MENMELPLPIKKRLERIEISLSRLEEIRKTPLENLKKLSFFRNFVRKVVDYIRKNIQR